MPKQGSRLVVGLFRIKERNFETRNTVDYVLQKERREKEIFFPTATGRQNF